MKEYKVILPRKELMPFISYYWIFEEDGINNYTEIVIPIGCMQLVFHMGTPPFSTLTNDYQPITFVEGHMASHSNLTYHNHCKQVVVVFTPQGSHAFFNIPMLEFYNRYVSVEDLNDKSQVELRDKILDMQDKCSAISMIEDFFMNKIQTNYNFNRICFAVNELEKVNPVSIKELSKKSCLSYKQFKRIFYNHVGINPKEFARIIRFQRSMNYMQTNKNITSTLLAEKAGYYDESHLLREFKLLTGYTPNEYALNCLTYSDYFIV
ncbi:AraC family transcriptional regulator [uncultured Dysgonomonas sp.]|nr:AraC family transcriptional regulator [uncultured Dysgonomonas sp.]